MKHFRLPGGARKRREARFAALEAQVKDLKESLTARCYLLEEQVRALSQQFSENGERLGALEGSLRARGRDTEERFAAQGSRIEALAGELRELRTLRETMQQDAMQERALREVLDEYLNGERRS